MGESDVVQMSERPKQPYATMLHTAQLLVEQLSPVCERIEIAGSLRRQKPYCSDIELVAIPKPILNLIGEPTEQTEVDLLLDKWPIYFTKRGHKYQQFWFDGTTMPFWVDLFLQSTETWGYNFMVRTGSAEFSKRMVTPIHYGGYKPNELHIQDARIYRGAMPLETPEERDIFLLWGMKFVPPEERL
jgi:DNA polymerase/3'-5' exonuclease PolX